MEQFSTIFFWTGDTHMTLQELHDQLVSSFPSYAQKDLQTAVRVLAKALHCPDPQHCPLDEFNRPLPSLYRLVETSLIAQGKSSHTIRNTKNNLSRLFRLAEDRHLLSCKPLPLERRYAFDTKPHRPGASLSRNTGTYLSYTDWPPDLKAAFTTFTTWATDPVVPGREASRRKRLSTIHGYRRNFEAYFGFLHHIQGLTPVTFDHLFDITLVTAFVHWHINEVHHRTTRTIHYFLTKLLALTRQYRLEPEFRSQLTTLKKTLPTPYPVYNKDDAWVSLATLAEIGRALWPQKQPHTLPQGARHPGLRSAVQAGLSLMFQLWYYIPYRQRNMREMQLDENLHKDAQGYWWITFRGEQLKVATKRGQINVFNLPFPDKLVPLLEEYLKTWRPLLLQRALQPSLYVFLTQNGTPYQRPILSKSTSQIVYRYTGKHWHPHIVRTVWATEHIRKTGDFYGAAYMLNDRLETVFSNYAHLRDENVAENIYRLLDEHNGQGK
jgi:site-specific recombinase XerC